MRISDWSSDVCSSDLLCEPLQIAALGCLFFVAWSASDRFGRGAVLILGVCLIFAFIARGYYESWASVRHVPAVDRATDSLTIVIGCVIAASMLSMNILERRLISWRSEEHTSELQSLMRTSYGVFCLNKKITTSPPQPKHKPTR